MIRSYSFAHVLRKRYRQSFIVFAVCLLFSGLIGAQELSPPASRPESALAAPSTPSAHGPYEFATNDPSAAAQPFHIFANPQADPEAEVAVAVPAVQDPTAPRSRPQVHPPKGIGMSASLHISGFHGSTDRSALTETTSTFMQPPMSSSRIFSLDCWGCWTLATNGWCSHSI
jgi:hypothetical protein